MLTEAQPAWPRPCRRRWPPSRPLLPGGRHCPLLLSEVCGLRPAGSGLCWLRRGPHPWHLGTGEAWEGDRGPAPLSAFAFCPLQTSIRPANSICPGESGTRLPGSIWDSLPVLQPWGTQGPVHSPKSAHQPQAPMEPLMARGARCGSYPTAWYRERHSCPPGVHAAPGRAVGGRRAEGRAPTRCDAEGWVCSERSLPLPSEQPPPPLMQFGLGEASSYSGNRLA